MNKLVPVEVVSEKIFLIRGQKVMIDADLALLYQVTTKALNQAIKRNKNRFPGDFMFQLTKDEKNEVVTNCDHLQALRFSYRLPYVFTEHGVAMLSSVLKSKRAVEVNILIIRAFIKLREILSSNKELAYQVEEIKKEQSVQNRHINRINKILAKFLEEPEKPKEPMGFRV